MDLSPSGATADSFPAPGPVAPYPAILGVFNGLSGASLNGVWKLYVVDDTSGDSGQIAGGYSVEITTDGAAPAPVAVVSGPLAFGSVNTGSLSATQNITVSNTGTANLSVSGVTLTGVDLSQFTVTNNGCTAAVAPAGNCIITVRFNQTTTGVKAAAVSIAHNAAGSPGPSG